MKKATDLLEFYRRARGGGAPLAGTDPATLDKAGPRLVLVRRTQVWIAAAAAGLGVLLAFLLGMAMGDDEGEVTTESRRLSTVSAPYVVRIATYDDTDKGRQHALMVAAQLKKVIGSDEVAVHRLPDSQKLVVSMGSWRTAGSEPMAEPLLAKVKSLKDDNGLQAFPTAAWWRVTR